MGAFWDNTAHFEFVSDWPIPITPTWDWGQDVGQQFVVLPNGTWYMFHRKFNAGPMPKDCNRGDSNPNNCGQVVRTSDDEGRTWSNYTVIAEPTSGRADDCTLTDGGGFYDAEGDTWHYLSQCLGTSFGGWALCHYSRPHSPFGMFDANAHNPVVKGGDLFKRTCAGSGKHCGTNTHDEGTPEILRKDADGYFWVTFHGTPGKTGVRGVAVTKDFVTWEVDGHGLPGDVIFSKADCEGRNWTIQGEPFECCGGGEGSIVVSGDYMYHLIEAPGGSLSCGGTRQWPLALVRATTFLPSPQWEQLPGGEPAVVPLEPTGCYIQYHRLFYDPKRDAYYLEYWTMAGGGVMQVYKLVAGRGPQPIIVGGPQTPAPPTLPPSACPTPSGSYNESCSSCVLYDGCVMECECKGSAQRASCDLHCCHALDNSKGALVCKVDGVPYQLHPGAPDPAPDAGAANTGAAAVRHAVVGESRG
eukprot:gene2-2211_t